MFKKLINFGHSRLALLDEHTLEVVRKSSASTVVKVAGMAIGLLVSVFLGRTIGAEGLGIINLSIQIATIVISISLLGISNLIVREVSHLKVKKDFEKIKGIMHTSYIVNGIVSLFFSLLLILLSPYLSENIFNEPRLTWPLIIASLVIPNQVFSRLFSASLIGYRKIWQSNLVDQTLSILGTGVCLLVLYLTKVEINVTTVAISYGIGRIIVTISVGVYWKKLTSAHFKSKQAHFNINIFKQARPFFLITVVGILATNIDKVMLGWLSTSEQVGLYSVASRIALLTIFFLQITNSAVSPKISSLYNTGKTAELEKMIRKVTTGLGLIALFPLLIFIIFGSHILSIWGNEFKEAYTILVILTIGQFVNITTGSVSSVMNMCGLEKIHSRITLYFVIGNIVLNFFSIKYFGTIGLAATTSFAIIAINIVKVIIVKKRINILSLPLLY